MSKLGFSKGFSKPFGKPFNIDNALMYVIFALVLIVFGILIYKTVRSNINRHKGTDDTVYCLMITGKSPCRKLFAQQSIKNFYEQDYTKKHLIVVTHGDVTDFAGFKENITVLHVDKEKKGLTLGDMRNIALAQVPEGALWTVWDDDDYRVPHYLTTLFHQMLKHQSDVVTFINRTEFNYNTGLVWEMTLKTGFVLVLARKDGQIAYSSTDSMEDLNLLNDFRKLGKKIYVYNNEDRRMYIRLVHTNNTSTYVNVQKNKVDSKNDNPVYLEKELPFAEQEKVRSFMTDYFKESIRCLKYL